MPNHIARIIPASEALKIAKGYFPTASVLDASVTSTLVQTILRQRKAMLLQFHAEDFRFIESEGISAFVIRRNEEDDYVSMTLVPSRPAAVVLRDLKIHSEKFSDLMRHPEWGLATWTLAVRDRVMALRDVATEAVGTTVP